jgi:hypothetical protein
LFVKKKGEKTERREKSALDIFVNESFPITGSASLMCFGWIEGKLTSKQEFQALTSSPVNTIGGIKNGNPTTVEQKSISTWTTRHHALDVIPPNKNKLTNI